MRLPNKYGSVVKLSGNRRRPYMARVTTGWTYSADGERLDQIRKVIGYYAKRTDALAALAEYAEHPYDPTVKKLTLADMYDKYTTQRYTDVGAPIPNSYIAAYQQMQKLHDWSFIDIKTKDMQAIVNACPNGYASKKNIKILFNLISKYAMANDMIIKNYAPMIELPPQEQSRKHNPFTEEELEKLWNQQDDKRIKTALILCYTGLRPTELLKIRHENVFLDKRYMMGGMKTEAGKNRVIPIAKKILPFIEELYDENNEFLLQDPDGPLNYDHYRSRYWEPAMTRVQLSHLPHDGRHTCATMMDNAEINDKIKKLILGHSSSDITQKVYTHKTIDQLIEAIDRI